MKCKHDNIKDDNIKDDNIKDDNTINDNKNNDNKNNDNNNNDNILPNVTEEESNKKHSLNLNNHERKKSLPVEPLNNNNEKKQKDNNSKLVLSNDIHNNNKDIIQNKDNVKRKISNVNNNINNINNTLIHKVDSNYSDKNSDAPKKYDNEEKPSNTLSENNSKVEKKSLNPLFKSKMKIEKKNPPILIKTNNTDNKNKNIVMKKNNLVERANLIKKKQTDIINDEIFNDNHFKKICNDETTQMLNAFVPFDLDPPPLYAENPETVSPLTPISEIIDCIYSIFNKSTEDTITRLRQSKDNTAECLNTLKLTIEALDGNEKSVISQLNKNMAIEKECLGEVDEVIKSINDD
ncbi:hypothetical protein PFMALIP_02476 [Plasmodium falciparum MaliPS096_E11]|uniref:Uncharacterized protein n=1 Tax=Plasmodium falciparum MaliPS096_E11 TaxID=1036727 RepID=A0A024WRG5_PLAFA|nr:hypothetical protein PFMALIP_02476 [Plasmodium falciparum MaliPS096_E11]